jgi:hypothetical protein
LRGKRPALGLSEPTESFLKALERCLPCHGGSGLHKSMRLIVWFRAVHNVDMMVVHWTALRIIADDRFDAANFFRYHRYDAISL